MPRDFNFTSGERRNHKSQFGLDGFQRIGSGSSAALEGQFNAIVAINGDVTLAAGIEVDAGDAPESGDVIPQEVVRYGCFTKITVPTSGTLLCYNYPTL